MKKPKEQDLQFWDIFHVSIYRRRIQPVSPLRRRTSPRMRKKRLLGAVNHSWFQQPVGALGIRDIIDIMIMMDSTISNKKMCRYFILKVVDWTWFDHQTSASEPRTRWSQGGIFRCPLLKPVNHFEGHLCIDPDTNRAVLEPPVGLWLMGIIPHMLGLILPNICTAQLFQKVHEANIIWLVVWNIFFLHILRIMIPTG